MKIMVSGGNGNLAKQLSKTQNNKHLWLIPERKIVDMTNYGQLKEYVKKEKPEVLIHAAAMTNPMEIHDLYPYKSIKDNIVGSCNASLICIEQNIKLVYISTDYVYSGYTGKSYFKETDEINPVNKYAWSKLGGECASRICPNSLILRCSFTERPFKHKKAFIDSYKSCLYIDEAAPIIIKLIERKCMGIYNVGGDRKSVYEFAKKSNPNVGKFSRFDIKDWIAPIDTSMCVEKMKNEIYK